ncbi:MAG: helix-turn-helix transcriptional regulator [Proteobacteria bacterium]|nr:helix-turn-helix transcriptional regulator [Pseudomonadota bacterium]
MPSAKPLRGGVPISDILREFEADPDMSPRLARARRDLARILEPSGRSLRALRLAAGLSQTAVAEGADSTQSYIARIESRTADPSTEMIGRIASALGRSPAEVFAVIYSEREESGRKSRG